jgi:histone deacetylase complex subunit SAP30
MNTNGNANISSEEESSNEICCLIEDGNKCRRPAGNASFSKRIQKTLVQKKLKLAIDVSVSIFSYIFFLFHL